MNGIRQFLFCGVAALTLGSMTDAAQAGVPQPVFTTPIGTPPVPMPTVYLVPYAVSDHFGVPEVLGGGTISGGAILETETVISIGAITIYGGAATKCEVQVLWIDGDGSLAGVSGPFTVVSGFTQEFTTTFDPTEMFAPYQQNIFSDIVPGATFEGHAEIRSSCPKLRVDAGFVTNISKPGVAPTVPEYKSIEVVSTKGNNGE